MSRVRCRLPCPMSPARGARADVSARARRVPSAGEAFIGRLVGSSSGGTVYCLPASPSLRTSRPSCSTPTRRGACSSRCVRCPGRGWGGGAPRFPLCPGARVVWRGCFADRPCSVPCAMLYGGPTVEAFSPRLSKCHLRLLVLPGARRGGLGVAPPGLISPPPPSNTDHYEASSSHSQQLKCKCLSPNVSHSGGRLRPCEANHLSGGRWLRGREGRPGARPNEAGRDPMKRNRMVACSGGAAGGGWGRRGRLGAGDVEGASGGVREGARGPPPATPCSWDTPGGWA